MYLTDFAGGPPEDVAGELLSGPGQLRERRARDSFKPARENSMPDGAGTYRGRYYN